MLNHCFINDFDTDVLVILLKEKVVDFVRRMEPLVINRVPSRYD